MVPLGSEDEPLELLGGVGKGRGDLGDDVLNVHVLPFGVVRVARVCTSKVPSRGSPKVAEGIGGALVEGRQGVPHRVEQLCAAQRGGEGHDVGLRAPSRAGGP